jgi:hypothetical protein
MMLQKTHPGPVGQRLLDLFAFLDGETLAAGIFEDRFGRLKKKFTVRIKGTRSGDTLRLVEDFVYGDGTESQRIWTLQRLSETEFSGASADVIGKAKGEMRIAAASMSYQMNLELSSGRILRVNFEDAFYMSDTGLLLNRATVTKWGLRLGQAIIVFTKHASAVTPQS